MKVLTSHEPSIIIICSQHATKHFLDILVKYKWISARSVLKETPIKEREKQFPHFSFTYPSGKRVYIFSCRHLKLFGYRGNPFKDFLVGLTPYLNIKR
ncbi:hypothetical protein [Priestia megaterium]|uniref:hypothetical protein n=1 Tax=Priestia megaterium TaxID=1404 RepID=UPI00246824CB|nr:hypothetical protein [Priestia megaterium]